MRNKYLFFFSLFFCLFFSACFNKEDFDLDMLAKEQDVDYDIALPLTTTRLGIDKLLQMTEGLFVPDEDNLVHLVYTVDQPFRLDMGKVIRIPDIHLQKMSLQQIPYFKTDSVIEVSYVDSVVVSPVGLETGAMINTIILDSIYSQFVLASTFDFPVYYSFELENVRKNDGSFLKIEGNLDKNTPNDLSQWYYKLAVQNINEDKKQLKIKYRVVFRIDLNQAPNELPEVKYGNFTMQMGFRDIVFGSFEGFLGQYEFHQKQELEVPELASLNMRRLEFEKAYLNLRIRVEGVSLPLKVEEFNSTVSYRDGTTKNVTFGQEFEVPTPSPVQDPNVAVSTQQIDIAPLLANLPYHFDCDFAATANYNGYDPNRPNTVKKTANMEFLVNANLPMGLSMDSYVLLDTIDFPEIADVDMIQNFLLKGIVKNAFPLDAYLNVDCINEEGEVLFSIVEADTLLGGEVGPAPELHVVAPCVSHLVVEFTEKQIEILDQVKKIVLSVQLDSKNKQMVKIYANSDTEGYLDFKLGVRGQLKVGKLMDAL